MCQKFWSPRRHSRRMINRGCFCCRIDFHGLRIVDDPGGINQAPKRWFLWFSYYGVNFSPLVRFVWSAELWGVFLPSNSRIIPMNRKSNFFQATNGVSSTKIFDLNCEGCYFYDPLFSPLSSFFSSMGKLLVSMDECIHRCTDFRVRVTNGRWKWHMAHVDDFKAGDLSSHCQIKMGEHFSPSDWLTACSSKTNFFLSFYSNFLEFPNHWVGDPFSRIECFPDDNYSPIKRCGTGNNSIWRNVRMDWSEEKLWRSSHAGSVWNEIFHRKPWTWSQIYRNC